MKQEQKHLEKLIKDLDMLRTRFTLLKQSEQKYRTMIEKQPEPICKWLPDTTITYVNNAYSKFLGKKKQELIGKKWKLFLSANSSSKKTIDLYKRLSLHPVTTTHENKVKRKDGSTRWLQWCNVPIKDSKGNIVEFLSVARDITNQKMVEEILRFSEEKFSKIFHIMPTPIAITNFENGIFIDVNKAFLKLFEYSRKELIGQSAKDIIWKSCKRRKYFIDKLKKKKRIHNMELSAQTKSGKPLKHLISSDKITIGGEKYIITAAIDITESKKREEEILRYQSQLKALTSSIAFAEEKERKRIAGEIHDNISHTLAVIKMKLGEIQASEYQCTHKKELSLLTKLIDEAISCSRTLTFELGPPILYELGFDAAVRWLTEKFRTKYGLKLEINSNIKSVPLNEDIKIVLFQSLRELLRNVVKHAHVKKVSVKIHISRKRILVRVKDRGKGFDISELSDKITKSAGFGLFNVRERIEYLGGSLKIQSVKDRGTCVTIIVPLH